MVNNNFEILDENIFKKISIKNYNMENKFNYEHLCRVKNSRTSHIKNKFDENTLEWEWIDVHNDDYEEAPAMIKYGFKKMSELDENMMNYNRDAIKKWTMTREARQKRFIEYVGNEQIVLDYLGIIPFTPSVMINISPNWGQDCTLTNAQRIIKLEIMIKKYFEQGFYDKLSYVIENGSQGDHIHAHLVCHYNPDCLKKTQGHIRKCNFKNSLMTIAKGIKGMEKVICRKSFQSTILNCQQLVDDKLDYLIEEKKPIGHKNKSVVKGGRIDLEL